MKEIIRALHPDLAGPARVALAAELAERARAACTPGRHGDLPRWQAALEALPDCEPGWRIEKGVLIAGGSCGHSPEAALRELMPWRKGPLCLGDVPIDTEWRSDWKWQRIAPHVDLAGETVLDVGGGNGYFGWRMLDDGAACVVGCDPSLVFYMQYEAIRHFAGTTSNHLLPLRLEDLPSGLAGFDTVFSLGVLYHRRDHAAHLRDLHGRLRAGGRLVLETLILDGGGDNVLTPEDRYARMRNVHALPTLPRLYRWLAEAGFQAMQTVDVTQTTMDEQRSTGWMRFQSLAEALDPEDASRTIEGLPAPLRAVVIARRPAG